MLRLLRLDDPVDRPPQDTLLPLDSVRLIQGLGDRVVLAGEAADEEVVIGMTSGSESRRATTPLMSSLFSDPSFQCPGSSRQRAGPSWMAPTGSPRRSAIQGVQCGAETTDTREQLDDPVRVPRTRVLSVGHPTPPPGNGAMRITPVIRPATLARSAHIDQARACDQAQWLSRGHTEQRGTFGRQTEEARSRAAQFHSRRFLFGVAVSTRPQSSLSFDGGRVDAEPKYRRYTRAVTPSTTCARRPNATASVAPAAYGPTPGRASRPSSVAGTSPSRTTSCASCFSVVARRTNPKGRITVSIVATRARDSARAVGHLGRVPGERWRPSCLGSVEAALRRPTPRTGRRSHAKGTTVDVRVPNASDRVGSDGCLSAPSKDVRGRTYTPVTPLRQREFRCLKTFWTPTARGPAQSAKLPRSCSS